MSEQWQFDFTVRGLIAPIEGFTYDNIQIKGLSDDKALVSFKVQIDSNTDKDGLKSELQKKLNDIAEVYGLITNQHLEILYSTYGQISKNGFKSLSFTIIGTPVFDNEQRTENVPKIEKALTKYKALQAIFSQKEKFFLRNAIDYYARSLKDDLPEEKLLDLMICLEALFNNENDELSYRYSLRVSSLLSIGQEDKRAEIYENMRRFYGQRSAIVHGVEKPQLSDTDVDILQQYAKEAIKRFMYIDMQKQEFVKLLDKSIVDTSKAMLLKEKVLQAIAKW